MRAIHGIIVVFIALVFVACISTNLLSAMGVGREVPKNNLREYIADLHPNAKDVRVTCPKIDSDGDGYVRCTGVYNDDGEKQVVAECATLFTLNDGCASPRNMIINNEE